MSNFIVEHRRNGHYIMETVCGVEDIDVSFYKNLLGIWVCDSMEETLIMEKELRELRRVDKWSSKPT
jgi:hypothetical protein